MEATLPSGWDKGITAPHKLANGEIPFVFNSRWYLYVWNTDTKDHEVYSYSEDIFIPYKEFQEMIDAAKVLASGLAVK